MQHSRSYDILLSKPKNNHSQNISATAVSDANFGNHNQVSIKQTTIGQQSIDTQIIFNKTVSESEQTAPQLNTASPTGETKKPLNIKSLPRENIYYAGRHKEEQEIYTRLNENSICSIVSDTSTSPILKDARTTTLTGLGGVGKTQLVKRYAYKYIDKYPIIWWFNANENIDAQYTELAKRLNNELLKGNNKISLEPFDITRIQNEVRNRLQTTDQNWLLIFDNAESSVDFDDTYFPPSPLHGRKHILVTSKYQGWNNAYTLHPFTEADALDYIKKILAEKYDESQARELAKKLGYFPLALAQATAYISAAPNLDIAMYINLFDKCRDKLWLAEKAINNLGEKNLDNYQLTVETTLELSIIKIEQSITNKARPKNSIHMLYLCALLQGKSIPEDLLKGWLARHLDVSLADPEFELEFTECMQILDSYHFLSLDKSMTSNVETTEEKIYSMHELVQLILQDRQQKVLSLRARGDIIKDALLTLSALLNKKYDRNNVNTIKNCQILFLQVDTLFKQAFEIMRIWDNSWQVLFYNFLYQFLLIFPWLVGPLVEKLAKVNISNLISEYPDNIKLLVKLLHYLIKLGDVKGAQYYINIPELEDYLNRLGRDATLAYSDLGLALFLSGDMEKSEALLRKAIQQGENDDKADKLNLAEAYKNLCIVLRATGQSKEAIAHIEKAVKIKEEDMEEKSKSIDTSYADMQDILGSTYMYRGENAKALTHLLKAKDIYEETCLDQTKKAYVYAHVGNACLASGIQNNEAILYHEKAIKVLVGTLASDNRVDNSILEKGELHNAIGIAVINAYANTLTVIKNYSDAINFYKKALVIAESKQKSSPRIIELHINLTFCEMMQAFTTENQEVKIIINEAFIKTKQYSERIYGKSTREQERKLVNTLVDLENKWGTLSIQDKLNDFFNFTIKFFKLTAGSEHYFTILARNRQGEINKSAINKELKHLNSSINAQVPVTDNTISVALDEPTLELESKKKIKNSSGFFKPTEENPRDNKSCLNTNYLNNRRNAYLKNN
jgi:hypothetical protein